MCKFLTNVGLFCVVCVLCSCATTSAPAKKSVVCTSQASCREQLGSSCPHGGIIYSVAEALKIEYSCNPKP